MWESGTGPSVKPAVPDGILRPPGRAASIAVLAFTDMSAAQDQDWFCDHMHVDERTDRC
jgi:TolB-like protein